MNKWSIRTYQLILILVSIVFFVPFLGHVHLFDWDEINFAESAREMIISGDYLTVQINFEPFWEKPPLFIWFQVISMKLFGINEFAARFPNAIAGLVTLLVFFSIGKKIHNKLFGFIWAVLYAASLLPFLYFKSGIIDPWFNLFIFLGVYRAYSYLTEEKSRRLNLLLSAVFIGLAVLTKGPVGFLLFGMAGFIFLLINRFRVKTSLTDVVLFLLVFVLVGGFWYILLIFKGNFQVLVDFFVYQVRLFRTQDAGHGGFLLYHFVVLFFGVFPLSVFALPNLLNKRNNETHNFKLLMQVLFWSVLILFTIVKTKIVHYSSLCYFPLSYLGALYFYSLLVNEKNSKKWFNIAFLLTGILLAILLSAFPIVDMFKERIIAAGMLKDAFAVAQFQAELNWKGYEIALGIIFLVAVVAGYFFLRKKNLKYFVLYISPVFMIVYFVTLVSLVPRAEEYSQKVYIDYLKEISTEDAYIENYKIKSYARFFYGEVSPEKKNKFDKNWLMYGDIDKPVYFILRNKKKEEFINLVPDVSIALNKNGYVILKREPSIENK
jgi:4-amino-4-deoxy-L-arabinose transferase-like glycosyltransferase